MKRENAYCSVMFNILTVIVPVMTCAPAFASDSEVTILSAKISMLTWILWSVGGLSVAAMIGMYFALKSVNDNKLSELSVYCEKATKGFEVRKSIVERSDKFGKASPGLHQIVSYIDDLEEKLADNENVVCTARDEVEEAVKQATQAREQGEAARCQGLLSAAQTLDVTVQDIRSDTGRLGSTSGRAQDGASDQQRYISEAVSAMEEMNAAVSETAMNAESAASEAEQTMEFAQKGASVVAMCYPFLYKYLY